MRFNDRSREGLEGGREGGREGARGREGDQIIERLRLMFTANFKPASDSRLRFLKIRMREWYKIILLLRLTRNYLPSLRKGKRQMRRNHRHVVTSAVCRSP